MTPMHDPLHLAAGWALNTATRLLARCLNLPEPLVASTGAYVFAQVAVAETRAAKTFCPIRLSRRLRAWFRNLAA